MNMPTKKTLAFTWIAPTLLGLTSGCVGVEDLLSTSADPTAQATAADIQPASGLSAAELEALRSILAELTADAATESTTDSSGTTPSLADPNLNLNRRDLALWAIDLALAQDGLTAEQTFALRLARAYLSRDADAMHQLVLEQLLTLFTSTDSLASG